MSARKINELSLSILSIENEIKQKIKNKTELIEKLNDDYEFELKNYNLIISMFREIDLVHDDYKKYIGMYSNKPSNQIQNKNYVPPAVRRYAEVFINKEDLNHIVNTSSENLEKKLSQIRDYIKANCNSATYILKYFDDSICSDMKPSEKNVLMLKKYENLIKEKSPIYKYPYNSDIDSEFSQVRKHLEKLKEKKIKLEADLEKKNAEKARVNAILGNNRRYSASTLQNLNRPEYCPYCEKRIEYDDEVEKDHIYPVHLNGLATEENMVVVCLDCNRKKGKKTLYKYAKDNNLDLNGIYERLDHMGKRF